ncbi:TPA: transcriptional regulator [Staphylococcus aureus]|nr:transcriptional regulator [Staphylococcus aureus]HDJ4380462.1 transcriptional regulator [Staphylococcus aureus]
MKNLIKLVMFVTALALVKKAVESLLVYLEANDEVKIPVDFVKTDHLHLNKI